VEGDIDTAKWNSGEATFEDDVTLGLLLLKGTIVAVAYDVLEHLFNFCETEFLGQLYFGHD
jgi:hypothetical protein